MKSFYWNSNWKRNKKSRFKEKDIAFVEEKYSIKVNDDIADAIGIGLSQIKREESDLNWE